MKNRTPDTPHAKLLTSFEIAQKDGKHLNYSWHQLFKDRQIDEQWVKQLENQPDEAVVLEAFVSRFARLQDHIAGKLIPLWLSALAEEPSSQIENLNRAEKLGVIDSTESWLTARQIRNYLVHEYLQDSSTMLEALLTAKQATRTFIDAYNALRQYTAKALPSLADQLPPDL